MECRLQLDLRNSVQQLIDQGWQIVERSPELMLFDGEKQLPISDISSKDSGTLVSRSFIYGFV